MDHDGSISNGSPSLYHDLGQPLVVVFQALEACGDAGCGLRFLIHPDLSSKAELAPGEARELKLSVQPGSRYVGVVAAYRDLPEANWRYVVSLEEGEINQAGVMLGERGKVWYEALRIKKALLQQTGHSGHIFRWSSPGAATGRPPASAPFMPPRSSPARPPRRSALTRPTGWFWWMRTRGSASWPMPPRM